MDKRLTTVITKNMRRYVGYIDHVSDSYFSITEGRDYNSVPIAKVDVKEIFETPYDQNPCKEIKSKYRYGFGFTKAITEGTAVEAVWDNEALLNCIREK